MTSLILKMSVSLDGYVAPADGSSDWEAAGRSPDGAEWVLDTVSNAGAHLVGAATYARWSGFWPSASGPFAAPMNEIPKVVFSQSLTSADWGETTIATGDLADAVSRLKQERSGGYLLAQGGVRFARSLVETVCRERAQLVDIRYRPMNQNYRMRRKTVESSGGAGIPNLSNIQGNVFGGFNKPHQALVFLKFSDAPSGKAFLSEMADRVTTSQVVFDWKKTYADMFSKDPGIGRHPDPNTEELWLDG